MLNWAKLPHKPDIGCYQTCLRWVLDEPCNTLPVLNFRSLCSGFACHVLLRLFFSSRCWMWCCRRKVSPSRPGSLPHSLCSPTSPPRDEDLVSWHGPLAAGLSFWLWTIFCNWAGEGCLCFCSGLGLPVPAAPPPPGLQITQKHLAPHPLTVPSVTLSCATIFTVLLLAHIMQSRPTLWHALTPSSALSFQSQEAGGTLGAISC